MMTGDYDIYDNRVAHMKRRLGYQDEIDQVAIEFKEQSKFALSISIVVFLDVRLYILFKPMKLVRLGSRR